MLDNFLRPIAFKPYSSVKHLEGMGNFTVSKYYKWPFRPFYRHKIKMIVSMMDKRIYTNILDFGCGPGVYHPELQMCALAVKGIDIEDVFDPRWKFEAIICASVLEFCDFPHTAKLLASILHPRGALFIASPMDTLFSRLYFKLLGDKDDRHSHQYIISNIEKYFTIQKKKEWFGLYFAIKAVPK